MIDIKKHSDFLVTQTAERDRLLKELSSTTSKISQTLEEGSVLESARDVVNKVLLLTQGKVRTFLEDIVTLALSIVYGEDYSFHLEYDIKRNQSEITPWIEKDGDKFSPREEVGGGVLDIVSLALRLAMWSLMEPKPAPVFVFDEPGRFLSRDKQGAFGRMLKEISELLNVQIIMVSHSTDMIEHSDKSFEIEQSNGISQAKEIKQ